MRNIALILILSLFLGSCATQRRCTIKFPLQSSTDSVYIETIKEVPVIIPGDTVNVEVPINCPDQDLVDIETAKLKQTIKILNGKLVSSTNIKPDTVFVHTKETKTVTKEVKVSVPEKYVPKIVKVFAWVGGICLVLLIAWFVLKVVKPKI
jgi:hypothetical protein